MAVTLDDLRIVQFDPNIHDVSGFDSDDSDINEFLQQEAWKYQADHISHTRLAYLDDRLVGYITLLTDCIILQTPEKKKVLKEARDQHQTVYTFPAIKIGRLGVQKGLQRSGVGTHLLRYTVGVVVRLNRELNVGCRFITLDAYPKSVSFYERKNFVFNKHYKSTRQKQKLFSRILDCLLRRAPKEEGNRSMRYDILKSPEIV
jgi:GNAT superfamily N-acetyltransferase